MAPWDCVDVPVGFKFHPTESDLLGYYLYNKALGKRFKDEGLVPEFNLYGTTEPWVVWDKYGGDNLEKGEDLYFFTTLKMHGKTSRVVRKAGGGGGSWHCEQKATEICDPKNEQRVLGSCQRFHYKNPKSNQNGCWIMIEYSLKTYPPRHQSSMRRISDSGGGGESDDNDDDDTESDDARLDLSLKLPKSSRRRNPGKKPSDGAESYAGKLVLCRIRKNDHRKRKLDDEGDTSVHSESKIQKRAEASSDGGPTEESDDGDTQVQVHSESTIEVKPEANVVDQGPTEQAAMDLSSEGEAPVTDDEPSLPKDRPKRRRKSKAPSRSKTKLVCDLLV